MNIGIVGNGHVGSAMHALFVDATVYDGPKQQGCIEEINQCDVVFVCVPTPMRDDGSCDTRCVDDVLSKVDVEVIVLRSTVPVGYTDKQSRLLGKKIVFQPEYYGETVAHPFSNLNTRQWITLGGDAKAVTVVIQAYQEVYTAEVSINIVDAKTAELAKYMENAYLATKVTFCNEFYDIAKELGVDYHQLRETWLMDPRMGRSHTFVYEHNRGYGGSCLPKDIGAIIEQCKTVGVDVTLLEAVRAKNDLVKG